MSTTDPTTAVANADHVTWAAVSDLLRDRYRARPRGRYGNDRHWTVPVRDRETLTVEVTLRPRWCSLAVDRWNTTDRDPDIARPWLEANIWPAVRAASRARPGTWAGFLPGGLVYASADPVHRADVLDVLALWVTQELRWCGTP